MAKIVVYDLEGNIVEETEREVPVQEQILMLESTITARRLREAVLTEEGKAWLENIEQQIQSLREA